MLSASIRSRSGNSIHWPSGETVPFSRTGYAARPIGGAEPDLCTATAAEVSIPDGSLQRSVSIEAPRTVAADVVLASTTDKPSAAPKASILSLGMSTQEVLATFPGSTENPEIRGQIAAAGDAPNFGVARLFFQPWTFLSPTKERFAGIDSCSVTLFDGRVAEMSVQYSGPTGPFWEDVDDFIAKLSATFNLPDPKDWVQHSGGKVLKCVDFEIEASTPNGRGEVLLHNRTYKEKVQERAAADRERLRREFKP
jgi:hypothetical protein